MQKKVLFTASTFSHILNFHLPYLAQFKRLGWQVHVACGGAPAAGLPEITGADAVFSLPLQKKMLAAGNFRAARLLRQKIAAEKYALISTHTSLAAFFTRLAMPASRPLLLNMVHGYLFDDQTPALKKTVLLTAEKLTAGCTDLLLTMNRWDLTAAQKHHLGRQIDFIPGIGVDFARFADFTTGDGVAASQSLRNQLGLRPQDWLLVYAAEFSGRKSQAVLLRALAELPRIMADELPGRVVLLLAGQGDKLAECKQLAAQLGLLAEGGPVRAVFRRFRPAAARACLLILWKRCMPGCRWWPARLRVMLICCSRRKAACSILTVTRALVRFCWLVCGRSQGWRSGWGKTPAGRCSNMAWSRFFLRFGRNMKS